MPLIELRLRKEKNISGVLVGKARLSHFAMVVTRALSFLLWYTRPQAPAQWLFVDVGNQETNLCVTVAIVYLPNKSEPCCRLMSVR